MAQLTIPPANASDPLDAPRERSASSARRTYQVYVIELCESVWSERRFRWRNHQRNLRRPCLYVGQTALPPEARFEQHRAGHRSNRYARRYGRRLRQKLARTALDGREPRFTSRDEAERAEAQAAEALKSEGYAVWSG